MTDGAPPLRNGSRPLCPCLRRGRLRHLRPLCGGERGERQQADFFGILPGPWRVFVLSAVAAGRRPLRVIRIISAWSANTFAALGHRQFRILFFGTLFATLAYMMMMFTMGIVAEDLSGTNAAVGMNRVCDRLSMFFLSPFGGVIADRINRKWLIVLGQGAGALLLAAIGLLLVAGLLTMPIFFVLSLFLGSTFVFMSPARQAFTADIVGRGWWPTRSCCRRCRTYGGSRSRRLSLRFWSRRRWGQAAPTS